MEWKNLLVTEQGGWLEVTVNRPAVLNALNGETMEELEMVADDLHRLDHLRGMILTGAGEKAFVAGADIAELADLAPEGAIEFARRGQAVFDAIERSGRPVIAAVNGYALGGGCELALACHLRVLSRTAKMGLPEVTLGVIPGYGGTQRLARLIGPSRALEVILTADPVNAEDALRLGLANHVCEPAELMEFCRGIAERISLRAPRAVSLALHAVLAGRDLPIAQGLAFEAAQFGLAAATEDWKEGTHAFLEKRKAQFRGC